ncbi:MAG: transposase domain-containing protein, partial [bacterium]|nr:transposase domain-containing protein [bacterium]
TANGARISANLYSLTETAKELGLDPELYFQWVLEQAPKLSNSAENWAAMLIPHKAPPKCRSVIIEIT